MLSECARKFTLYLCLCLTCPLHIKDIATKILAFLAKWRQQLLKIVRTFDLWPQKCEMQEKSPERVLLLIFKQTANSMENISISCRANRLFEFSGWYSMHINISWWKSFVLRDLSKFYNVLQIRQQRNMLSRRVYNPIDKNRAWRRAATPFPSSPSLSCTGKHVRSERLHAVRYLNGIWHPERALG